MKNIIFILIDSLNLESIQNCDYFNELKKKSLYLENLYSLAPYTEAALIASLGGERTLENGEYVKALDSCNEVLAEVLKENRYETYSSFDPFLYSSSFIRGIDHFYYDRSYDFFSLKEYRLNYYKEKFISDQLTNYDVDICYDLIKEGLNTLKIYYENLASKDESVSMIAEKITPINYEQEIKKINREINCLEKQSDIYIYDLFSKWDDHSLFKIEVVQMDKKVDTETEKFVKNRYEDIFRTIDKKLKKNKKKSLNIKSLLNSIYTEGFMNYKGYLKNLKDYYNLNLKKKVSLKYSCEKLMVSAHTQLDFFKCKIMNCELSDNPYFMFIHLEDFHTPSMFFSYDIDNKDIINDEIKDALLYIDSLKGDYNKNILADLSARYIDKKIKAFVEDVNSMLKHDTLFIITADHGYSYNYEIVRKNIVNNFYRENYNIPFFAFFNNKMEQNLINKCFFDSTDLVGNVLQLSGAEKVNKDSKSFYSKGRDYILIEYLGPGCPDIYVKPIYYAAFNEKYKICIKITIYESVSYDLITEIYDLEKDPCELYNLIYKKNKLNVIPEINYLLEKIRARHEKIIHIIAEKSKERNCEKIKTNDNCRDKT